MIVGKDKSGNVPSEFSRGKDDVSNKLFKLLGVDLGNISDFSLHIVIISTPASNQFNVLIKLKVSKSFDVRKVLTKNVVILLSFDYCSLAWFL